MHSSVLGPILNETPPSSLRLLTGDEALASEVGRTDVLPMHSKTNPLSGPRTTLA